MPLFIVHWLVNEQFLCQRETLQNFSAIKMTKSVLLWSSITSHFFPLRTTMWQRWFRRCRSPFNASLSKGCSHINWSSRSSMVRRASSRIQRTNKGLFLSIATYGRSLVDCTPREGDIARLHRCCHKQLHIWHCSSYMIQWSEEQPYRSFVGSEKVQRRLKWLNTVCFCCLWEAATSVIEQKKMDF